MNYLSANWLVAWLYRRLFIGDLLFSGTILLDKNGVVIVYMNKDLPVQFMFDTSQGRSGNSTAYALQWGPLIGPNRLFVENNTVVPMVSTFSFTDHLQGYSSGQCGSSVKKSFWMPITLLVS